MLSFTTPSLHLGPGVKQRRHLCLMMDSKNDEGVVNDNALARTVPRPTHMQGFSILRQEF